MRNDFSPNQVHAVLRTAHALNEFTLGELSIYAGVPEPVLASVLLAEYDRPGGSRIRATLDARLTYDGDWVSIYEVTDPEAILAELRETGDEDR